MAKSFGDQVKAFADKAKRRQQAIFRDSVQEVLRIANTPIGQGGNMPVDTGNLRNSARASTAGMPSSAGGPPELIFATMQIGQTVNVGWTARYARRQEYGFYGTDKLGRSYSQRGNAFLRRALQQWPLIVAQAAEEARRRIK